jgi:hypothetical protein
MYDTDTGDEIENGIQAKPLGKSARYIPMDVVGYVHGAQPQLSNVRQVYKCQALVTSQRSKKDKIWGARVKPRPLDPDRSSHTSKVNWPFGSFAFGSPY